MKTTWRGHDKGGLGGQGSFRQEIFLLENGIRGERHE